MELFSSLRTAASRTGADHAALARQLPILDSCVASDDTPVLLAHATRPGDRCSYLMLLTERRLVVTAESRFLRRQRLHLSTDPRHLGDVIYTAEPTMGAVVLSATAVDGVREHFWIRSRDVDTVTEALSSVFHPTLTPA